MEEAYRKYVMNAAQRYRWKRNLDQKLKGAGELIPKSQVLRLQRWVEELGRALWRKALDYPNCSLSSVRLYLLRFAWPYWSRQFKGMVASAGPKLHPASPAL